jgi:hypothetical protein
MSAPSSAGSAGSTSGSNVRECELCGSASRTLSAGGSLRSTGPGSRVIPTCAPLWPTPGQGDGVKSYMNPSIMRRVEQRIISGSRHVIRKDGGTYQESLPERVAYLEMTNGCPCRCHTSMSSAEGSPAKTSPTPAREQGSTGNARVFGPSTPDSFANYDPDTSSWRTSQLSLLEDSGESLLTWPRAGMTRSGIASRLRPLAPLTGGTESGLLPTPTAQANQASPSMRDRDAGSWFREDRWPTPKSSPSGPDYARASRPDSGGDDLATSVARTTPGALNPTWVEWLMGFPIGWTDLEASETPSFPRLQSGSGDESSSGKAA